MVECILWTLCSLASYIYWKRGWVKAGLLWTRLECVFAISLSIMGPYSLLACLVSYFVDWCFALFKLFPAKIKKWFTEESDL